MSKGNEFVLEQSLPLRKQVYRFLRDQILSRSFDPATRMIESQIANQLGISRTPVREALHLLEQDGFVESIPRIGYRVLELDIKELDEVIEIRRMNEALACTMAVRNYSDEILAAFQKTLAASEKAIQRNDTEGFLETDEKLHDILARGSGSRHLNGICQMLRRLMLRYRTSSIRFVQSMQGAHDGHLKVVECYRNRDEQGMVRAMHEHLDFVREDVCTQGLDDKKS